MKLKFKCEFVFSLLTMILISCSPYKMKPGIYVSKSPLGEGGINFIIEQAEHTYNTYGEGSEWKIEVDYDWNVFHIELEDQTSSLLVRYSAGGNKIGHTKHGENVFFTGNQEEKDGVLWYEVQTKDEQLGWVSSDYLVTDRKKE